MAYSDGLMSDPAAGTQPLKIAGVEGINRRYRDAPGIVSQKLAARGYGSSGKMGNTMFRMESDRLGGLGDLDAEFAKLIMDRQNQGASLGAQLLNSGRGTETTSTGSGDSFGSALQSGGNAMGNIASLLMMQKILKP